MFSLKIKSFKLTYFLRLAVNGLYKNRVMSLSAVLILLSCLVIMGSFALVLVNVDENVSQINHYNKIVVFAKKGTNEFELELMQDEIEDIPGVAKVEFKSNDEALEEQLSEYNLQSEFLLETYKNDNPLKDSFIITCADNATRATIDTVIMKLELLENYEKHTVNLDVVDQINNLKNAFTLIASWLMILLFIVSLFVIINTVKLSVYARRDEIALMRYIGATDFFISFPFLVEGLIIGFLSAGIGFGLQYLLYKYLMLELIGQYDIISILPFSSVMYYLIAAFAVIGIATGFVGSLISLKKYNKENA